jgi:hypothetical protein
MGRGWTALGILAVLTGVGWAQEPPPRGGPPGPGVVNPSGGDKIAWYATLRQAREEAKRTGKPILLVSAAPHCHNTPGVW